MIDFGLRPQYFRSPFERIAVITRSTWAQHRMGFELDAPRFRCLYGNQGAAAEFHDPWTFTLLERDVQLGPGDAVRLAKLGNRIGLSFSLG